MGLCSSRQFVLLGADWIDPRDTRRGRFQPHRLPHLLRVNPRRAASEDASTRWRGEPRVILANDSDYIVSYWVIQEDKMKTKEHREKIVHSMGLQLSIDTSGGGLTGDIKSKKKETIEMEEGSHFLMRDHRMGAAGSTQPTRVAFPADCEEVRVFGFFERGGGEWQCYKNKVYSISRRKKNMLLTALNSNIAPYADKKSPAT